ncbi:transcription initiation factor IIF [Corynespora cassiicola Philippines]|uniref:Transcription initiation factor IIF subunit beta n=1 Tax=Corynespora cassiicola Philippines TaxID=1448308 RepID=A0A2T2NCE0_CORCC|nr:transcription initiation factor IIF [Corynespora cassiicola Philippines]
MDPDVKADPDAITPTGSGYMDDDFYEDTGELSLPPKNERRDLWLTRIPDWLYEAVSNWGDHVDGKDDDLVQIGEVLAFPDEARPGAISNSKPMRVFFNERWQEKTQLPSAFQLQDIPTKDDVLGNTYIFTEKDLPGYKPNGLGQNKGGAGGSFGGVQDSKSRIQKRTKYKKAIPKQTALVGCPSRQYQANPLNTKEFVAFNAARTKQAIQGANTRTNILDNINAHVENETLNKRFKTFIKPVVPVKTQINKAARIPKNELIDQLHSMFDEYAYWPMKSLKARTKQPEAYLKECLADIAQLVKSGPYTSCWVRQASYNLTGNKIMDKPPDEGIDSGDEEMEDVV